MITIRTKAWPEGTGKIHTSSIYQIGATADFSSPTNVLQEVVGDNLNGMLNIGIFNLSAPVGVVWYGRYRRSFNDGTQEEFFSNPEIIISDDVNNSKFIKTESVIAKPSIKVEDKETFLKVTSSLAKIDGADGHLYSTYLFFNNDELVYKVIKDKVNLNSLSIPLVSFNYKAYPNLTIMVVFGTVNGAESQVAKTTLETSLLSYSLAGTFDNVPYNRNIVYTLTSPDNNVIVNTAYLYNGAGENLGEIHTLQFLNLVNGLTKTSEIYLDSDHLSPDEVYTLRLGLQNDTNASIKESQSFLITTSALDEAFVIDKNYVYTTDKVKLYDSSTGILPVNSNSNSFSVSYQSNQKDIMLTSATLPYSLSMFTFYPNSLELLVSKDTDLAYATDYNHSVSFFTRDKRMIVASAISDTTLRVVEFNYNPYATEKLIKTETTDYAIPNAKACIAANAIAISDDELYLYLLPINLANEGELTRINLTTNTKEFLARRLNCNLAATFVNLGGNKFLSTHGSLNTDNFYIYNSSTNEWTMYNSTYPTTAVFNNCQTGILRKDNKVFLFAKKDTAAKYMLVFDVSEKTYTEKTIDIPSNYVLHDVIRNTDGGFVIVAINEFERSEKALIYIY